MGIKISHIVVLKESQKASNDEMTQMKKMKMKWNKNKKLLRPEQGVAMKESEGYIGMKDVPATQKVPDAFFPQGSWYKLIQAKLHHAAQSCTE